MNQSTLTAWARLVADSLVESGVRHAILSPGSRSTPFAWALLEHGAIQCRSVLDERSAGFVAVGQAKMSGVPSVLVCTSGSAPANYFPSVMEAANSATPLLVLSADRPWELQDCGAPQTVDQLRLYGVHTRAFVELGMPEGSLDAQRGLRRKVCQAVFKARWPVPGPVHLNARARKPLEPLASPGEPTRPVDALGDAGPPRFFLPQHTPATEAISLLVRECQGTERGLIVCGAAHPWQAVAPEAMAALAEATGFPVLAEATSQQRFSSAQSARTLLDGFEPLLRSVRFRHAYRPDCVLHFGAPLLSQGWAQLAREFPSLRRHAINPSGYSDPENTAATLTLADPTLVARALAAELMGVAGPRPSSTYSDGLARANHLVWKVVDDHLRSSWNEVAAMRAVVVSLASGSVLALGSSLPLRIVDLAAKGRPTGVHVWSQRGTNGIDGLLSGAIGAALATRQPTALVMGDLSFLHDVGGLGAARDLDVPLAVVVLNNNGGRIFEQLPVAQAARVAPYFVSHWVLPHQLELVQIAGAFGLRSHRVASTSELAFKLESALAEPGCTVLEAVLPPDSAGRTMAAILHQVDQDLSTGMQS